MVAQFFLGVGLLLLPIVLHLHILQIMCKYNNYIKLYNIDSKIFIFWSLQNIKIAVGSLRSDSGLLLGLAKVIIHGDYNPDPNTETFRANNDISLLKVDKDIDFGQNTNFIRNSSRDVETDSLMELSKHTFKTYVYSCCII